MPCGMGLKSSRGESLLKREKGMSKKSLANDCKRGCRARLKLSAKRDILMNKNPISIKKAEAANSSDFSRIEKALEAEKAAREKQEAREKELLAQLAQLKAEKAESKKKEKAAREELASVKKTLAGKLGEIDILARAMIEISSERPAGWTRKELFTIYLEKLGIDEAHEKAPAKEATLCAQCGSRIQPRLQKLGYRLERASSELGKALYICKEIKS